MSLGEHHAAASAPGPAGMLGGRPAAWPVILREAAAGATVGCIMLPFCVTAGVLAYEPLGPDYIGAGAASGILCAVAGGVTGALARSSSFIPNIPSVPMALIQASFIGTLLAAFDEPRVALALAPLSVLLAGCWQMLIAASGLARAVKFTPYPVLAGFVTGLAVLTFTQQLPRLFGAPGFGTLLGWLATLRIPAPAMPLFGAAVMALISAFDRFAPRVPAMLGALVIGTGVWHALAWAAPGLDLGRTIGAVSLGQATVGLHLEPEMLARMWQDGRLLQALLLTSLTLGLLGTIDFTFAIRSAQNIGDCPSAPRRDLAGQGLSNMVSALAGGLAVTSTIAFSRTNHESGGRTRLSTISIALVLLAAAAVAPRLIAALPIVVLAAILVSIAIRMWDRWCLVLVHDIVRGAGTTRVRARRNALIVLAVMAATVLGQPVVGALVGTGLSCLVFILEMSRPIIRRKLDGRQLASKRIRSQHDRAALAAGGGRVVVLDLQGVLFFGNADDLASEVKALEGSAEIVILDLRRVSDLDTSGATVLSQIAARCHDHGMRLIVAAASPDYGAPLGAALAPFDNALLAPDLDDALEAAEDLVLARQEAEHAASTALRLDQTDLAGGLSERELETLARHLTPCSHRSGEVLCQAGHPADRLWILTRGSVSVRLPGERHARRVAGLGPGTAVGEMGLLDRRPRSADVVADEDVDGYVLTAECFDALLLNEPHLGQSLLATIARLTAQRLRATSEELRLAET